MMKIVCAVLLIFIGVITWAYASILQDPNLITSPNPPWIGTGMTESEFEKHLRAKALPYKLIAAAGLFTGAALLMVTFKKKKQKHERHFPEKAR